MISFSLNISGASNESVYVKIDDLKIIGKHNKLFEVEEYLGIPFAQPPIDLSLIHISEPTRPY